MNEEPEQAVPVPDMTGIEWDEPFKVLGKGRGFIGDEGIDSYSYTISTCMWNETGIEGGISINFQGDMIYLNSENAPLVKEVIDIFLENMEKHMKELENGG